jgi:hypothetical protein
MGIFFPSYCLPNSILVANNFCRNCFISVGWAGKPEEKGSNRDLPTVLGSGGFQQPNSEYC